MGTQIRRVVTAPLRTEPAGLTFAVRAVIYALVAFHLVAWTEDQIVALLAAVDAVLTVVLRAYSTSVATLEQAGTSPAEIVARAAANQSVTVTPFRKEDR